MDTAHKLAARLIESSSAMLSDREAPNSQSDDTISRKSIDDIDMKFPLPTRLTLINIQLTSEGKHDLVGGWVSWRWWMMNDESTSDVCVCVCMCERVSISSSIARDMNQCNDKQNDMEKGRKHKMIRIWISSENKIWINLCKLLPDCGDCRGGREHCLDIFWGEAWITFSFTTNIHTPHPKFYANLPTFATYIHCSYEHNMPAATSPLPRLHFRFSLSSPIPFLSAIYYFPPRIFSSSHLRCSPEAPLSLYNH